MSTAIDSVRRPRSRRLARSARRRPPSDATSGGRSSRPRRRRIGRVSSLMSGLMLAGGRPGIVTAWSTRRNLVTACIDGPPGIQMPTDCGRDGRSGRSASMSSLAGRSRSTSSRSRPRTPRPSARRRSGRGRSGGRRTAGLRRRTGWNRANTTSVETATAIVSPWPNAARDGPVRTRIAAAKVATSTPVTTVQAIVRLTIRSMSYRR